MTVFLTLFAVLQSFAISLGVGSSTLAILNFFSAIADGTIDATERRMMGIVYRVLRVAMLAIVATTVVLVGTEISYNGIGGLTGVQTGQCLVILVLCVNAVLMSKHIVPSNIGPALQAGSWYALGALIAMQAQSMNSFSILQFCLTYALWLVVVVFIVNGVMSHLKKKRREN